MRRLNQMASCQNSNIYNSFKRIQSLRKHSKILQHMKVMPNINYCPKHRRVKVLVSR